LPDASSVKCVVPCAFLAFGKYYSLKLATMFETLCLPIMNYYYLLILISLLHLGKFSTLYWEFFTNWEFSTSSCLQPLMLSIFHWKQNLVQSVCQSVVPTILLDCDCCIKYNTVQLKFDNAQIEIPEVFSVS